MFGEWGRPDMMMMKFIDCHFKNETFSLYNYGKHHRDFTYWRCNKNYVYTIKKNKKLKPADIYNICSNRPVSLKKVIEIMKKK